jgi:L-rhamnono-1,4-lactonase
MGRNGHQKIIDSHVHLWPAAAANFQSHAWMTADHPLAKGYSISDYVHAINEDKHNDYTVTGFVYVETDRRTIDSSDIKIRTSEHLKELSFLRKIIETTLDNDTQCSISGIVAWAPLDGGPYQFQEYIEAAQEEAGALVWSKVKGFRYLLQDIKNEENFLELSESNDVVEIFKIMGKNQWSFDIGVDQRQGGSWQLQLMFDLIEKVNSHCNQHEMVTFVLSKSAPLHMLVPVAIVCEFLSSPDLFILVAKFSNWFVAGARSR